MPTNTKALQVAEPAGIVAGKNAVINGGFDIWQRGTSFNTSSLAYTADRWNQNTSGSSSYTLSRQTTSDTTNLPFIQYCMRLARNSSAGGSTVYFNNSIEIVNTTPLVSKTITMSFYARVGSANTHTFTSQLWYQTSATDYNVNAAGSWTNLADTAFTPTTTWARYSITVTVPSTATQIAAGFKMTSSSSSATSNDYVEITGVQLELGNTATPFSRAGGDIQGELAACQRYYYRTGVGNGSITATAYEPLGYGSFSSSTVFGGQVEFPVSMRAATSSVDFSNVAINDTASVIAATNVTVNQGGTKTSNINVTVASGGTQYRFARIVNNNNTAGYLAWSAEL